MLFSALTRCKVVAFDSLKVKHSKICLLKYFSKWKSFQSGMNRTAFTDTTFQDTNSVHSFLQCQEIWTSDFTYVFQLCWVILKFQAVNQEEEFLGELLLQELIYIVLHGYPPEHLIWSISFWCNLLSLCPYLSSVQ